MAEDRSRPGKENVANFLKSYGLTLAGQRKDYLAAQHFNPASKSNYVPPGLRQESSEEETHAETENTVVDPATFHR